MLFKPSSRGLPPEMHLGSADYFVSTPSLCLKTTVETTTHIHRQVHSACNLSKLVLEFSRTRDSRFPVNRARGFVSVPPPLSLSTKKEQDKEKKKIDVL